MAAHLSDMIHSSPIPTLAPIKAAQYVRMSTEHQRYSTQNQADAIERYAHSHGMAIVQTFADDGKSGLNLEGRAGLLRLLSEVQNGRADFSVILVYDISRWGRFQDADESGYWEYVCKRSGVAIHYCAEQFANDGSLSSVMLKSLKRTMAGEYSRELSVKVFAGQCRLIELGYRQGGVAGFGLRRQLVDQENRPKELLDRGTRKSLQSDRVVLVPGPETEQSVVRQIYSLFIDNGKNEQEIADLLNSQGAESPPSHSWTRGLIHQILINPKYSGTNIYNRKSFKLKQRRVANPEAMWVRKENAFPALVSHETFLKAAEIIEIRSRRFSENEMVEKLRELLLREGRLSGILIDEMEGMPSSSVYRSRFGTLTRAYSLVGFTPERDYAYIEVNRALRATHSKHLDEICSQLKANGASLELDPLTGVVNINSDFSVALVIVRCHTQSSGRHRWLIRLDHSHVCNLTIAARMTDDNEHILDYYLLPTENELARKIRLAPENPLILDVYRFENLNFVYRISRRTRIGDVA